MTKLLNLPVPDQRNGVMRWGKGQRQNCQSERRVHRSASSFCVRIVLPSRWKELYQFGRMRSNAADHPVQRVLVNNSGETRS